MQHLRHSLGILAAVGCCLVSACGTSSPNVPVSGHVSVKGGLPVDEGKLVLIPEPADPKRIPCGASIATDGSFSCYSNSGGVGIPPGKYKVVLSFASGKGNINPFAEAFLKYTQASTTPLVLDVPKSGIKNFKIELDEPPAAEEYDSAKGADSKADQPADAAK
jgi:hypothetical protein